MREKLNILVTGASRGIGHAISKHIAKYAENLFLTSLNSESLQKGTADIRESFSRNLYLFNMDQSKGDESAKELADWIQSITDRLDVIIFCAGNFFEGDLCNIDKGQFENSLNTNFLFNYFAAQKLVPLMTNSTFGRIVIIGSTAAYSSYEVPSYSVSKWALRGLAVNLRKELSEKNVGVTFISPGPVLTDMWADVDVPEGRILEPNDIAKVVCSIMDLSPQAVLEEVIIRPMLGDYYG